MKTPREVNSAVLGSVCYCSHRGIAERDNTLFSVCLEFVDQFMEFRKFRKVLSSLVVSIFKGFS